MSSCTGVLATSITTWDGKFEGFLRQFLPFLNAGDSLTEHASLRDLGLDSMGTVELLAVLENGYRVRFRDEALTMTNFATPGVLWTTLSAIR
jgi:nodulation protein F